jgi:hypothetical protein
LRAATKACPSEFRPVFIDKALNVTVESFPLLDRQFGLDVILITILLAC